MKIAKLFANNAWMQIGTYSARRSLLSFSLFFPKLNKKGNSKVPQRRRWKEISLFGPQHIFCEGRGLTHFPFLLALSDTAHTLQHRVAEWWMSVSLCCSCFTLRLDRTFHTVQGSPCQMCYATRKAQQMHQSICFAASIQYGLNSAHLSYLGFLSWFTRSSELCWLLCILRTKPQHLHKLFPLPSVLSQAQLRQKEELGWRNTIEIAPRLWKQQCHHEAQHIFLT